MIELSTEELLPSYAVGDVPSAPLTFDLDTEYEWSTIETNTGTAMLDGTTVEVWLDELDEAGIITVRLVVSDAEVAESVVPLRVVVEDPDDGWLTLDQARAEWADAPDDPAVLYETLMAARVACLEFAPPVETVPGHYRRAQLLQTIAVWTSSRATNTNQIGDGETSVTVYPLDWNVKQLLRPKSATGGFW